MTLDAWRRQHPGALFAIVDGAADPDAVRQFYQHSASEACPLFAGTAFDEQLALGPWLLVNPCDVFIASTPNLRGFYLISAQVQAVVYRHWQRLLQVIRDGEAVWFRFSEPRILLPMLSAMNQDEQDAILGPCSGLWINGHTFAPGCNNRCHPAAHTPWFVIRPPHLAALYDEQRHGYILRRRLWQVMTKMMERHPDPAGSLLRILHQANAYGLTEDVRDGVVACALTLQAGLALESIRAPLGLTDMEWIQVRQWLAQHSALTGVD